MYSICISEVIEKQELAAPIYIPTPKHILEARKVLNSTERSSEPPEKKKRLEYVPESRTNTTYPTPTYIPSKLNANATNIVEGNINGQNDLNSDDITGLLNELTSEHQSNDENHSENVPKSDVENIDKTKSSSTSRHHHSSHKSSRSQSNRSHSDRDQKISSNKSSHRSSSSSNKSKHSDKSKNSDKSSSKHRSERKSSSSSSSSSSKHRPSSHSSKSLKNE